MSTSLRRRLLVALSLTVLAAWLATAAFSYQDARRRIGAMLDDHLVQAATLLLTHAGAAVQPRRPPAHWGRAEEGHSLVYQGWSADGRLLFHSADAPDHPLSARAEGFSEELRGGERWRVYGLRDVETGTRVQVAEHAAFRSELAASVARHLLHPLAIALPVLAALLWLAVRWGLAPLRAFAHQVEAREPSQLAPLQAQRVPDEVRPLADALDALLRRVAASVEHERRFTADAAHELRTPLAGLQTHAEVALAARDARERDQALAHVAEGTQRASRLVAQLLALARLDARSAPPPLAPVPLAQLAAAQVAELAPFAAQRGINLGLVVEEGGQAAAVPGDADLLGVLLRNLVDNAVRYTPRGGTVDVTVRPVAGQVLLEVLDSGPGIPPQERARVLERFHRIRGSGEEGSGLGLSIVARIAQLHRAPLTLAEGPGGRGLRVTVALPRAPLREA
ncbi:MAG TPA: ATP-binding protein [Aggregicoccus sp.]|nr:ATP-binding protein [Aggregicoccus sp.]